MTRNQVITAITEILTAHKMVNSVIPNPPANWLMWNEQPKFPNVSFDIDSGSYNVGLELVYNIQFWVLDKSGVDNEFEQNVTNDMHLIGADIINSLRQGFREYSIDEQIAWTKVEEKFEDYLTGVNFNLNLYIKNDFSACDIPV